MTPIDALKRLADQDDAEMGAVRAIDLARFGRCADCGATLDGRWGRRYCQAHAKQDLPFQSNEGAAT